MCEEEKILALLAEICGDDAVLQDLDIDLYETGLMDSIDWIEFFDAVEDSFHVTIYPTDLRREEMNTPGKLVKIILQKLS